MPKDDEKVLRRLDAMTRGELVDALLNCNAEVQRLRRVMRKIKNKVGKLAGSLEVPDGD